jgi:hypothetical protein
VEEELAPLLGLFLGVRAVCFGFAFGVFEATVAVGRLFLEVGQTYISRPLVFGVDSVSSFD